MSSCLMACITVAVGLLGSSDPHAQPTPKEILSELTSRRDALENANIESTWEELYDGVATSWEDQHFLWDSLGRRRVVYSHGRYEKDGKRARPSANDADTTDTLFDGEIVAYQQYFSQRDRVGQSLEQRSPAGGYRTAIISDAQAPLRRDLESHRNPKEYLSRIVIRELGRAIPDNRIVGVTTDDKDPQVYKIEWREPADTKQSWERSVAVIDAAHGWTITSLQSFAKGDRILRTIAYEYQQGANGMWLPTAGSHKHWGDRSQKENPVFEWRFKIPKCQFNDPALGDSAFALKLADDTAVSDTRYKVNYRVGTDGALKSDLARLVEKARAEPTPTMANRRLPWGGRWIWIVANSLIITAILAYLALTYWSRRNASQATGPA